MATMSYYKAKQQWTMLLTELKFILQPVLNPDSWTKDFVLINRWKAKRFEKIQRGDIVSIV